MSNQSNQSLEAIIAFSAAATALKHRGGPAATESSCKKEKKKKKGGHRLFVFRHALATVHMSCTCLFHQQSGGGKNASPVLRKSSGQGLFGNSHVV